MTSLEAIYLKIQEELVAVLGGESESEHSAQHSLDAIGRMATIASVLYFHLPSVSWVGFYRSFGEGQRYLQIGPYQGPLACLEIDFKRGVCGQSARTEQTLIVDDVAKFSGHIACDSKTQSEIVVPYFDQAGKLAGVLDLDSHELAAFNGVDQKYLEKILALYLTVSL
jgi:L-methionine (R)-S-oxide reductase